MSSHKSKNKYTVGYWYGLGSHMVLCHGPIDNISEIKVGERVAWSGNINNNQEINIYKPELFGGEQREGGVIGKVDVLMGDENQPVNNYLKSKIGNDIPAFRGVVSLVLKRVLVSAMNPYIKPWSIRAKRIPKAWNPLYAEINGEANPAHIIHECITNYQWGMGYSENDIDNASFEYAAKKLSEENFGISLLWSNNESIERFILTVLNHIDGMLYVHRRTGLFVLKLARNDYDIDQLPVFNDSNIITMENFTKSLWGEIINQITLVYRDKESGKETAITVHDLASIQQNGGIVPETINYPGISNSDLANRVAMRDLQQLSSPLSKCTIITNRTGENINIGDVIKLSWSDYGIELILMRVVEVDYGMLDHGSIKIQCIQDVFNVSDSIYINPPLSEWINPISPPKPCPYETAFEAPYWMVIKDFTGEFQSLIDDIDDLDGLAVIVGSRPSSDALGYNVIAKIYNNKFEGKGSAAFTPVVKIVDDMPQELFSSNVKFNSDSNGDIEDIIVDSIALIDNEFVSVFDIDISSKTISLYRGVLDTVPVSHSAESVIYFFDDFKHYITQEYVSGETVDIKLLTKNSIGILPENQAQEIELTFDKRFIRPYCPGNIQINDLSYPEAVSGEITITWSTRNRQSQTAYLVHQSDGPIIPEQGQTTNIIIYDQSGSIAHTEYNSSINHYTWSLSDEILESSHGGINSKIGIKIYSSRDVYNSFQSHYIEFDRAGYGFHYGKYYGGI